MHQQQRIGKALCTGLPTQVLPGTSHAFSSGAGLPGRPQAEIWRRVVAVEAGRQRRPGTPDRAAVPHATGPLRLGSGRLCAGSARSRGRGAAHLRAGARPSQENASSRGRLRGLDAPHNSRWRSTPQERSGAGLRSRPLSSQAPSSPSLLLGTVAANRVPWADAKLGCPLRGPFKTAPSLAPVCCASGPEPLT